MERKIDVKKIVCLSICVVLIIVACIVGVDYNSIGLKSGSGKNARMTSLDDMSDMLTSFSGQLSGFDYSKQSASLKAKEGDTSAAKYTSVTIHEQTSGYAKSRYGEQFSTTTIQRSMDIGITSKETYYHVVATMSYDARMKEYDKETNSTEMKNHYSDIEIDLEMYMSENRFLLRFNKFSSATDGKNLMGMERVLGQWADFTDDTDVGRKVISSLGSINNKNFRVFGIMGDYIGRRDEDIFGKRGNVYSLKGDATKSFATAIMRAVGSGSLATDFECGFDVDLSDDTNPLVTLLLDSDYSDRVEGPSEYGSGTTMYDISARVYEKDVFEFTNINNTVIDIPSSISTLTAEQFDDYMNEIEEKN